ncbi:cyclic nucleotide-binding domain-containing protein [Ponticoccus sp. SC2-23]|uniref:Crp/Fnr family transcriptional regulator n=1 Tax=Alexandriicola marinus TaxID=2081710 RepID=UPI0013DEB7D7|nr:cyclic nucleotide-binding domain-containing protein [Alexandriicola marinus]MBM1221054.1 cyclic nucleotide-binding domain-containing protein [Ponticoccus sp. SC6-9]MBM1225624.1 cyclic nucleotide-binding domain-containing protein [Ponticoccus sp. SC6-15]MBM1227776.1 cyclic nucleotide-binding domain-containing protein [Ponticoccus sp. SC6-38]MBM1234586.1 cyclic nucleotide-binding domain-containing protein [Ponticoccus sp. SC6-45]MBM1238278.1 cyclic nucleotide-binding domain-containing protein
MQPDIVIVLAGLAFIVGYLIINQVILRLVLLLGTALYILYYFIAGDAPLWGAIYASMLTFTANLIGLGLLLARRAWWMVPPKFRDMRDRFASIPPGDLRSVLRHAHRYRLEDDLVMTREGRPVDTLYFVLSGRISAEKLGERFLIPSGVFVGEVAYLTGRPSSATITVDKGAEVISWSIEALARQTRRNPRARLALEALISTDLAAKVALAVAPKNLPPEYS